MSKHSEVASQPKRIQRKRTKGWKMPPNTLCVTRPGRYGNPFKVGQYVKLGHGGSGMAYLICLDPKNATPDFTWIITRIHAVEMFREYRKRYPFTPEEIAVLQRADYIACFCPLDQPCHADVLLEIANEK